MAASQSTVSAAKNVDNAHLLPIQVLFWWWLELFGAQRHEDIFYEDCRYKDALMLILLARAPESSPQSTTPQRVPYLTEMCARTQAKSTK